MKPLKSCPFVLEKSLRELHCFLDASKHLVDWPEECNDRFMHHLKMVSDALKASVDLSQSSNRKEKEIFELAKAALLDLNDFENCAPDYWAHVFREKVASYMSSTQLVDITKLTDLMKTYEDAGQCMEGQNVVVLFGAPGCGKTTTLLHLAGTSFKEVKVGGNRHLEPDMFLDPSISDYRVGRHSKDVSTTSIQTVQVELDGNQIVICDIPSIGSHESDEQLIANNLGLSRALQRAKTVRPILVLSQDELGLRQRFPAFSQMKATLHRLLSHDQKIDFEPLRFVFTKYDERLATVLEKQLKLFLSDPFDEANGELKRTLVECLVRKSTPHPNIILPMNETSATSLRRLVNEEPGVLDPEIFFKACAPQSSLVSLRNQLKISLNDLKEALENEDNGKAIYRLQQMGDLANVLPEAGGFARMGFRAVKGIIADMIERSDESVTDEPSITDNTSTTSSGSEHSHASIYSEHSQESEKSNKSSKSKESQPIISVVSSRSVKRSNVSTRKGNEHPARTMIEPMPESQEDSASEGEEEKDDVELALETPEPKDPILESRGDSLMDLVTDSESEHRRDMCTTPPRDPGLLVPVARRISQTTDQTPPTIGHDDDDLEELFTGTAKKLLQEPNKPENQSVFETFDQRRLIITTTNGVSFEGVDDPIMRDGSSLALPEEKLELSDEDMEYAEEYSTILRDMAIRSIEQENYIEALEQMHELNQLAKSTSVQDSDHDLFKSCVELFLVFTASLREEDYSKCNAIMEQLISLNDRLPEARRCSQLGLDATVRHIIRLRESVTRTIETVHAVQDPNKLDVLLEKVLVGKLRVEKSDLLLKMCMRRCDNKGKSETILACISHGFKLGKLSR